MKNVMSSIVCCLFLVSSAAFGADAKTQTSILDGKTFSGKVGDKGEKKGEADSLVFENGKFHSTVCDQYGFKSGTYTEKANGNTTTFEADVASENGAKMHWTGTVNGSALHANATWTKKGDKSMEKWFDGKADDKKAKK